MPLNNPGASTAPLSSPAPASPSMRGFTAPVTHETSYSIFLRKSGENALARGPLSNEISSPVRQKYELRYFGHAVLTDEKGGRQPRGLQLIDPGRSYTEALGTVFVAAIHVLGLRSAPAELSIDGMKIDPAHAIEKLRHHGFRLMGLDEFMRL